MKKLAICLALGMSSASCAGPLVKLSEPISTGIQPSDTANMLIGIVADSQLQTRKNYNRVPGYRGSREEKFTNVSIRPPALDWAARSMLKIELDKLAKNKINAVFYLGDGANNGCFDELAVGFDDGTNPAFNDRGLLRILHDFRVTNDIPVFFVIGNHDILGAGSTSQSDRRDSFCEAKGGGTNPSLGKPEVIALAEKFNRMNSGFSTQWAYRSNYDVQTIERDCGSDRSRYHRQWGCYLAATVDYRNAGDAMQFLLLDTTDFASVSKSALLGFDQEGARGAMSFGTSTESPTLSQTGWFDENASGYIPLRIALTHYNIGELRKGIGIGPKLSAKSQKFADLFLSNTDPIEFNQYRAYVVSAHSHTPAPESADVTFKLNCGAVSCRGGGVVFTELNVGSTTDYTSYATLLQIDATNQRLAYAKVEPAADECTPVYAALANFEFDETFDTYRTGWKAIGVNGYAYRDYDFEDLGPLWKNLAQFTDGDLLKSACIGRMSAEVEKTGMDPVALAKER